METRPPTDGYALGELAQLVGGKVVGDPEKRILRPVPAGSADSAGITFAESAKYLSKVIGSGVGAILVPPGTEAGTDATVEVDRPRAAFGRILALFSHPLPLNMGIHPTAVVADDAWIDPSASVGPYVVIESGARIGAGCRIHPFCYVGQDCVLGDGVQLMPHVVLYANIRLGAKTTIHAGSVLGADGFGYVWTGQEQMKVPQVGGVRLGERVEIGALTAIDRATAGDTTIGDGTKIDNFVQVAHNLRIGDDTVIAGHVALAGSGTIGSRVTVGGQVATNAHVTVADDVVLAGRTGVESDISEPGIYFGLPATPHVRAKRVMLLTAKLPELYERVKQLEKRLAELDK